LNIQIQIEVIKKLFTASELCDIPLWLGSGWAIDARLGEITREHGDIDIAFPSEKREE
jgi:aminoglycoside 2''-adenylyltransferase